MKHYKTKRDQYCCYWRITLTYISKFSEWGQLLMSRTQSLKLPFQGIFIPSSYLVLIGGPKAPLPARVVRRSPPTPTQPSLFRERSWTSSTKENRKLSFSPSQWLMEREFGLSQRKESSSYTASLRYVKEGRKEIHICFLFSILCVCVCVCVWFCLLVCFWFSTVSLRPGQFSDSVNDSTLLKAL